MSSPQPTADTSDDNADGGRFVLVVALAALSIMFLFGLVVGVLQVRDLALVGRRKGRCPREEEGEREKAQAERSEAPTCWKRKKKKAAGEVDEEEVKASKGGGDQDAEALLLEQGNGRMQFDMEEVDLVINEPKAGKNPVENIPALLVPPPYKRRTAAMTSFVVSPPRRLPLPDVCISHLPDSLLYGVVAPGDTTEESTATSAQNGNENAATKKGTERGTHLPLLPPVSTMQRMVSPLRPLAGASDVLRDAPLSARWASVHPDEFSANALH